jgi:diguanylate cyclase (GGDEF)-like protein
MDFLTGIYNRRHFIESAEREIARSKRYKSMMTVAILDIDWFKEINDQFGHAAGDEVIKGIADNCRETIRGTDILGRIGGEEFAMILIETDLEDSFAVAERLRKRIESHVFKFDGQTTRCTVSIGISAIFPEKDDLETIMKRADAALYEAKQSGRNRTCRG